MRNQNDLSQNVRRLLGGIMLVLASSPTGGATRVLAAAPASPNKSAPVTTAPKEEKKRPRRLNADSRLRVVDEQGHEVAKFDVLGRTADHGRSQWENGSAGQANLRFLLGLTDTEAIDIVVRAPEFATTTEHFMGAKKEKLLNGEATLVLRRGEPVQVRFQLPAGMTWPADVKPEVYFDDDRDFARAMWQPTNRKHGFTEPNTLGVRTIGPGQFEFRLSRESTPVDVAVCAPGFLQSFERGPFTLADFKKGVLDVGIEKPATLTVHFEVGDRKPQSLPFETTNVIVYRKIPRSRGMLQVADQEGKPLPEDIKLADLTAGDYIVMLRTRPKPTGKPAKFDPFTANPGAFRDFKNVTLASGQSQKIDLHYVPYNADAFHGNRTAVVHIVKPDGKPAAGREITISYMETHYGGIPVFAGKVPPSGEITLKDITAKVPEGSRGPYLVLQGWDQLGSFNFRTKDPTETFKFLMPPDAGDPAPDVDLLNVSTGKHSKLSDFQGRVVCLDFWATWCGPCQQPMKNLDKLSAEKGDRLKGHVVIVPLSIDDRPELVTRHIAQRGWTHLDHYWSGTPDVNGFEGAAARAFVISGVPTTFLIDRNGRIIWRGHPMTKVGGKDLETRIEEEAGN